MGLQEVLAVTEENLGVFKEGLWPMTMLTVLQERVVVVEVLYVFQMS